MTGKGKKRIQKQGGGSRCFSSNSKSLRYPPSHPEIPELSSMQHRRGWRLAQAVRSDGGGGGGSTTRPLPPQGRGRRRGGRTEGAANNIPFVRPCPEIPELSWLQLSRGWRLAAQPVLSERRWGHSTTPSHFTTGWGALKSTPHPRPLFKAGRESPPPLQKAFPAAI